MWINIKTETPPTDRTVKYRCADRTVDMGILTKEFIEENQVTHWAHVYDLFWD